MQGRLTIQDYQEYLHLLKKKNKKQMEVSYWPFFERAWKEIEPTTDLVANWHIQYIAKVLEEEVKRIIAKKPNPGDIIINVPPGTSKSTLVTKLLPAWAWLQDPSMKIITSSYSGDLARDHAVMTRDLILGEWYQKLWKSRYQLKLGRKRKSQYENDKGGSRSATSVTGRLTGMHADIFIIDDPLDPRRASSEIEIKKPNAWWDKTVPTRLTNQKISVKIIVMQRLHEDDLTGHVLAKQNAKIRHICLPAKAADNIRPRELTKYYTDGFLDPERYPQIVLDRMLSDMGSLEYAGQMGQSPSPEEGNLIKPDTWFSEYNLHELQKKAGLDDRDLVWDFTIDGAFTEDEINAPTALMAYARYQEHTYIREVVNVWMELPELIKFIPEFVARNGATKRSRIIIEPKASGLPAAQSLQRYRPELNVILDKAPRQDKVARVKSVLPYMEAGKVHTLKGASWKGEYYNQLKLFPNSKYKDMVDVTTMAINQEELGEESFIDFAEIG